MYPSIFLQQNQVVQQTTDGCIQHDKLVKLYF